MNTSLTCSQLSKSLLVIDLENCQSVTASRFVYLSGNAIFFAGIWTSDPVTAYSSSDSQLYFSSLANAYMAYIAILAAAKDGCDKLAFLDRDVEAISFRFYHDDWHEPRPLLLKSDVH